MVKGCSRSNGNSPPQWHDGTACRWHQIVRKVAFALIALASVFWLSVGQPYFFENGRDLAHGATNVEKQSAFTWVQVRIYSLLPARRILCLQVIDKTIFRNSIP